MMQAAGGANERWRLAALMLAAAALVAACVVMLHLLDAGRYEAFVGAALVLSLYALMIWRALRILTLSKNLFGALVAGGVVAMLMFQVFVNVGMTIGIAPITGIPLPLMSYGGSSVITTLLAFGLLQSIYAQGRAAAALKGRVLTY